MYKSRVSVGEQRKNLGLDLEGQQQYESEKLRAEQDEDLEFISSSISQVGLVAETIDDAIKKQNDHLENIGDGMEKAGTGLDHITIRTQKLVEKAGGPRPCFVMGFLSIVAIVLLFLVIYT